MQTINPVIQAVGQLLWSDRQASRQEGKIHAVNEFFKIQKTLILKKFLGCLAKQIYGESLKESHCKVIYSGMYFVKLQNSLSIPALKHYSNENNERTTLPDCATILHVGTISHKINVRVRLAKVSTNYCQYCRKFCVKHTFKKHIILAGPEECLHNWSCQT